MALHPERRALARAQARGALALLFAEEPGAKVRLVAERKPFYRRPHERPGLTLRIEGGPDVLAHAGVLIISYQQKGASSRTKRVLRRLARAVRGGAASPVLREHRALAGALNSLNAHPCWPQFLAALARAGDGEALTVADFRAAVAELSGHHP